MTLQWTAVALFLYIEIGILLILCLPFISAQRWQKVFNLSIWNSISRFWNKGFLAMIIILIVLFLDAVREVRKYSAADPSRDVKMTSNMVDHLHMKLFRAQRNLYISGFSLFLWLVMRRVIMLISQLAVAISTSTALHAQTEAANLAARKYMEDIEMLKQALEDGAEGEKNAKQTELLRKELQRLSEEQKTSTEALRKSKSDVDAMKKQTEDQTKEYDRLLEDYRKLQNQVRNEDKKDM